MCVCVCVCCIVLCVCVYVRVCVHICTYVYTFLLLPVGITLLSLQVIVGVHSDESYVKLKQKCTIDNTEKRMDNVKKYADQVCV